MNKVSREVPEQLADGDEVVNPDNSSAVLNAVLNAINNRFEHQCVDEVVRGLNDHPICQSQAD